MKTIEFMGVGYQVEDWVNWVALDCDRTLHGYEYEPIFVDDKYDGYYWQNSCGSKTCKICLSPPEKLIKVV